MSYITRAGVEEVKPGSPSPLDDELDEILLKPAQWQYDDYQKAKARIKSMLEEAQTKLLDKILVEGPKDTKLTTLEPDVHLFYSRGNNLANQEWRALIQRHRKGGEDEKNYSSL